jgi:putative PIN family toxin of toxin-antitoxin system
MMKRVVVDTNVFISAIFWKGTPGDVIEIFIRREAILVLSVDILAELTRKLKNEKFTVDLDRAEKTVEQIVEEYQDISEMVVSAVVPENAVRDHKDRIILASAIGGKADFIVSGDKDLTSLKVYQNIPILTPAQFLTLINAPSED